MIYLFSVIACFVGFIIGYVYRWRGVPFVGKWKTPFIGKERRYTIGIYTGNSNNNFSLREYAINPVLVPSDVNDVNASFLADPFLFMYCNKWFMFMEVMNRNRRLGEIGYATSIDGIKWAYQSIVLREAFHLSYPFVFEYAGEIWMVPETSADSSVRLYRSIDFPNKWKFEKKLLEGYKFTDASIFQHDDSWWMFVSRNRSEDLLLFFADKLTGPWLMHPQSPVVYAKPDKARCAGRPICLNGKMVRFSQDCDQEYGRSVRAFGVEELNRSRFRETELYEFPILYPSKDGWNANGMHHIDLHVLPDNSYLAAVDGCQIVRVVGLKY
jgi:hypothetical protein